MNSRIFSLILLLSFIVSSTSAQVTYKIRPYSKPAIGGMMYKDTDKFLQQFEKLNVGNLHVYTNGQSKPTPDFFFMGNLIDRKWYQYFDRSWRTAHPKKFSAYATYLITIGEELYFLVRVDGKKYNESIELFSLEQGVITHHQTLASYTYELGVETQLDSWIKDFDLDSQKDILKKMSINYYWKDRPDRYSVLLKQYSDQVFEEIEQSEIDANNYRMHETK